MNSTRLINVISIVLVFIVIGRAQPYPDLNELTTYSVRSYYSPGNEQRAEIITGRCHDAIKYVSEQIDFTPSVRLFILNPEQWKKYATFPFYGMPHYAGNEKLIIASEDNAFWRSFIPPADQISPDFLEKITQAYTTEKDTLSMMAFFDLLAIHELGHGFHIQAGLKMQRSWMQELFCNILLHTYIAENEPSSLPALELFPEMVVGAGTDGYQYTTLAEFEEHYINMDPKNYGWYQCKLHVAAKNIYNAGGVKVFTKLWKGLKDQHEKMTDDQFATFLKKKVHKSVANVQLYW